MGTPGYSDLAAQRREFLSQRLEARKRGGVDRLRVQDGLDRLEELERKVRIAEEQLASTSAVLKAIRARMRRLRQAFYGRGEIWRRPFTGVGFWAVDVGVPRKETTER